MVHSATLRVIFKISWKPIDYLTLEKYSNYLIINSINHDLLSRGRAREWQVHGGTGDSGRPLITSARDRHIEHFVLAFR